jgi:hypothetical protein
VANVSIIGGDWPAAPWGARAFAGMTGLGTIAVTALGILTPRACNPPRGDPRGVSAAVGLPFVTLRIGRRR